MMQHVTSGKAKLVGLLRVSRPKTLTFKAQLLGREPWGNSLMPSTAILNTTPVVYGSKRLDSGKRVDHVGC